MGLPTLIIGVALVGGILLLVFGLRSSKKESTLEERLAELGALEKPPSLEDLELSLPFSERVLKPLLQRGADIVSRMAPAKTLESTRHKLELAGYPYRIGAPEFLAVRYVLAGVLGVGATILLGPQKALPAFQKILLIPVLGALGAYLPIMWLGSLIGKRQTEIVRSLPDALDLLTICVEAGLGFDAAIAKVADKWDNELSLAFTRVLQEIQLGKLRREALRSMADSVEVADVSSFIAAVIQADTLGVSISKVLRIQSDQMRVRRRQRAEELARQAPLKMMIPIATLIFPSLFIVLLGPAALTLKNSALAGMFGMP
jgi:tight adherence protein C